MAIPIFAVEDSSRRGAITHFTMSTKNETPDDDMRSTNDEPDDEIMMCCASCGIAQVDDIKLKTCTACKSVRYCSVKCQREHRPKHKKTCKQRAADLRDEILFRQPESSHLGDCPICFLPLPLDLGQSSLYSCCNKMICNGCVYVNSTRQLDENLQPKCPFCRHLMPWPYESTDSIIKEELDRDIMNRIEKNDPVALREMGTHRYKEGDYEGALEHFTKAAVLGDAIAHYQLSTMYKKGIGVEKDEKKDVHHLEEAAIAGNPNARYYLACNEGRNERYERAVKHLIIAAHLGHNKSMQTLKGCYKDGDISKEDFAAALRAHHAAVDAMTSPQREAASAVFQGDMVG
jgi:tetratricopeptide (TPR) repeat protein